MNWAIYFSLFLFSTIKFLFTPFGGPHLHVSFFETYFSCLAGGVFSATVFFFSSEFFMKRAKRLKEEKKAAALKSGVEIKHKPVFTRTNKAVVRLKRTFGIYGICIYAPLFLSVPIGTIIAAKFYGKDRRAFPIIVLGLAGNGILLCLLSYFVFG